MYVWTYISYIFLKGTQRSTIIYESQLWTSPVPYVLENDLEMNARGVILRAFDHFRLKSCIDFKPRDSEDYYISVQKLGGCFSYIGQVSLNGQVLSIGKYCDTISTVEHEFLHALGFFHEQSRYDRDDHVIIVSENIQEGKENNFGKVSKKYSSTQGVAYDYNSVMHYGKNAFSNGNGSTIITKDPKFQDVIGQRLEVSPDDMLKLNRLYRCESTIAFKMYCGFYNETICGMKRCSKSGGSDWERVTHVVGGPSTDHTSLPSARPENVNATAAPHQDAGYFMHASTESGQEGDSAWLETKRMNPSRECHVQCLQFYYFHSGSESDQLNIWIREFKDETDSRGQLRLMGQITGPPTSHWQLHHVPLDAATHFQVEFEVRKGAGDSSGGFSIDDINLSETECPHLTWQINDFEERLTNSAYGSNLFSPRQYSAGGYAYQVAIEFYGSYFGMFVSLVSGDYDDQLEWPCPWRQATFVMLDQNPNIQLQMSKQMSIATDPTEIAADGDYLWDNPRTTGTEYVDENNQTYFAGPLFGRRYFGVLEDMKSRDFLKGGSLVLLFSFQDISILANASALPCAKRPPMKITHPPKVMDVGPCGSRPLTTTRPPQTTTEDDNSIFGFSPGLVSSPLLILLPVLMLLAP
ncbi:meprin A subunit beta-like [Centroberyx gerrardi]|uniref:meprin A subunit beta-like n=1 Tax=Centroberyx gerrardi TaxID=166262 RepID=UPI003AAC9E18